VHMTRTMMAEDAPGLVPSIADDLPPIHIRASDHVRLVELVNALAGGVPHVARMLREEIDRAEVHPDADLPPDVVGLDSVVEFEELPSGTRRCVQVVLPWHADLGDRRVAVTTPVGVALLGMRKGARISWPYHDGQRRVLRIIDVLRPDASGPAPIGTA